MRRFSSSFSRGELVIPRSSTRPSRPCQAESTRLLSSHPPAARFLMVCHPVCHQSLSPLSLMATTSGGLTRATLQPQPPAATRQTAFTNHVFSKA
jgi:hypothetical protein